MLVTRITNTIFGSNTYILSEKTTNYIYLVDVGDIEPIINSIPYGTEIRSVFLTHSHYDHLYGINELTTLFPDCIVYTSQYGKLGLYSDKLNLSKYLNQSILFTGNKIQVLQEDDEIEIFPNQKLKVVETPGHDPSCLTYCADKYVFTGDSYIPNLKVVTTFPKSNKKQAENSVNKILSNLKNNILICPGHTDMIL